MINSNIDILLIWEPFQVLKIFCHILTAHGGISLQLYNLENSLGELIFLLQINVLTKI